MINRIFFISERVYRLPAKAGVCGAIRVAAHPEETYKALSPGTTPFAVVDEDAAPTEAVEVGMSAAAVRARTSAEAVGARAREAFLFIPGCIGLVRPETRFEQPEAFLRHYATLLQGEKPYGNDLFFEGPEAVIPALVDDLERMEGEFARAHPTLYAAILRLQTSEVERDRLTALNQGLTAELDSQRQFVEVLRSGHAAKEIQEYYNREYEVLPLWYKRAGHLVKVLTGKRTWRSLFRDDVKKYTD